MKLNILPLCFSLVFMMSPLQAQSVTLAGKNVSHNVKKVIKSIDWKESSFEELKEEAQKKNKMIFWLQIVGELGGGL